MTERVPSGKFVLRIPSELHAGLKRRAGRAGLSLNQLCSRLLQGEEPRRPVPAGRSMDALIPESFRQRLLRRWGGRLVGLVLFGSRAREDSTAEADVDLLLVFEPEYPITRALYSDFDVLTKASGEIKEMPEISPHFVRLPDDPMEAGGLWYEVAIDGIVLWERGLRLSRFLAAVRRAMARGEIRRAMTHGHPYWIKRMGKTDEE